MSHAYLLGASGDGVELITLTGITATGYHGVYDDERRDGQPFVVDATIWLARRHHDDDVATTLHYGELAEAIAAEIEGEPVNLIETLAARIADRCLSQPVVMGAVVTVHKPKAPIGVQFGDVSVTVVRRRSLLRSR